MIDINSRALAKESMELIMSISTTQPQTQSQQEQQPRTQKIVPNLWCNGNAEEAVEFYASAFNAVFGGASGVVDSAARTSSAHAGINGDAESGDSNGGDTNNGDSNHGDNNGGDSNGGDTDSDKTDSSDTNRSSASGGTNADSNANTGSVAPRTTAEVTARYPSAGEGLLPFQEPLAGKALTAGLHIAGPDGSSTEFVFINAGPEFQPNPSISFFLNFDPLTFASDGRGSEAAARKHLTALWERLSDGGIALMPLGEYPFSAHYGWVQDRFGVSWQLMLTKAEGEPRPFVVPSLMFGSTAQNRAKEALDLYVRTFGASNPGTLATYPVASGPVCAGDVMYADFQLEDQWFAAMDAGSEQDFTFTCGVSLEVRCTDQAELDHVWNALSAVPEAEQCGWLADQFGVSWQVGPANMGELMERPGAFEKLMQMKKIVIADF